MKKIYVLFLLAVSILLTGCQKDDSDNKIMQTTEIQPTEKIFITETESLTEEESEAASEEPSSSEESILSEDIWDFSNEKYDAYSLTREELKNLRKDRELADSIRDTGLPQELVAIFKDILLKQKSGEWVYANEILDPYETKERLVEEEKILEFLGDSVPVWFEGRDGVTAYVTDLEGDGKEELILFLYYGNAFGPLEIEIWEKKEDGTGGILRGGYRLSKGYAGLLSFEGGYYAVAKLLDFAIGDDNGFFVLAFPETGIASLHEVLLESQGTQKSWHNIYRNKKVDSEILNKLESYLESQKSKIENGTAVLDEALRGSAEKPFIEAEEDFQLESFHISEPEEDCTIVDLDNDGELECCYKYIWRNGEVGLIKNVYKRHGDELKKHDLVFPQYAFSDSCTPWQLWFEEIDGKVYLFSLDVAGASSDFALTVGIIENGKFSPLLQYLLVDRKEFRYQNPELEEYKASHDSYAFKGYEKNSQNYKKDMQFFLT